MENCLLGRSLTNRTILFSINKQINKPFTYACLTKPQSSTLAFEIQRKLFLWLNKVNEWKKNQDFRQVAGKPRPNSILILKIYTNYDNKIKSNLTQLNNLSITLKRTIKVILKVDLLLKTIVAFLRYYLL